MNVAGTSFNPSDNTEFGDVRATAMFADGQYETILQFTWMKEEEIQNVLGSICG